VASVHLKNTNASVFTYSRENSTEPQPLVGRQYIFWKWKHILHSRHFWFHHQVITYVHLVQVSLIYVTLKLWWRFQPTHVKKHPVKHID